MKRLVLLVLISIWPAAGLRAQSTLKRLTVQLATDPSAIVLPGLSAVGWRPGKDQISYVRREEAGMGGRSVLYLYDISSQKQTELLDSKGGTFDLYTYQWSPDGNELLLRGHDNLWLYTVQDGESRRLTNDSDPKEDATFSPTGERVAFVKNNNLCVLEVKTGATKQLTTDGNENVMNGKLDWVYEEEMANRATGRAYEWSPDGNEIAYMRLDDSPVPEYPLTHYLSTHVTLSQERFPQAGDPNPIPSIHVVDVQDGKRKDGSFAQKSPELEYLGPSFAWTPDSKEICYLTLNRPQTELGVRLWNASSGADRNLLTEHDQYWINSLDPPYFLKDGKQFLWLSERDNWLHLYLYNLAGQVEMQLTKGDWLIDHPLFSNVPMFQVDEKSGWIYFTSTNPDPRERQIYRVRLDDGDMQRLSREPGTHTVDLSPDGQYLIDTFSTLDTPPVRRLFRSDGSFVATLDKPKNHLSDYALGKTELVNVKAADGATLYARLLKPANFDPAKKYPVIVDVYGGPHVQLVRNAWGVTSFDDQLFAQEGFLVWSLDNRGSWGRGHAWETPIFENMGQRELEDQLAGVTYLKSLPYVDPNRIGIRGWSYGGYMTLYALTHAPDVFKYGAAGGPVTDWKYYDSIYTERYMRTPEENPEGYVTSSPLAAAANLKAPLLLIHGTDDDNVHMQNTMNFIEALVKVQRPFELYLQPGQKHGFAGDTIRSYLNERELDFFKDHLLNAGGGKN